MTDLRVWHESGKVRTIRTEGWGCIDRNGVMMPNALGDPLLSSDKETAKKRKPRGGKLAIFTVAIRVKGMSRSEQ